MPSIEWRTNGSYYRCDSSDPVVLARWLIERITEAPGLPSDLYQLQILPMYSPRSGPNARPDWPGMQTSWSLTAPEDLKRLANYLIAWQAEHTRGKIDRPE